MVKQLHVSLFDLVMCLADAIDLVSKSVSNHHKQVAYVAFNIGKELGLPLEQRKDLVMAGALHDIGLLSLGERLKTFQFYIEKPYYHAELGYSILSGFDSLQKAAEIIKHHHAYWDKGAGREFSGEEVLIDSHILHLADRIAVQVNSDQEILEQVKPICEKIKEESGKMFHPELVDAFLSLAEKEYFWFDLISGSLNTYLRLRVRTETIELGIGKLTSLAKLFSQIIDFRSHFTANHSTGVAASAETLARLAGFSDVECRMMRIAGYLHDLGKLAVPTEILEKPGSLTRAEYNIMRSHTYHTYRILEPIDALDEINTWASFHHERLDGNGYPFHVKGAEMPLGSRIMAVADIFTAIMEDRPYRLGMSNEKALGILHQMASNLVIDKGIAELLKNNFDEINMIRKAAQELSRQEYQNSCEKHNR